MKISLCLFQVKACDVALPTEYIPFRYSSGLLPFLSLWHLSSYLPHSGIISFFLIRGLITCDLSGTDPTPTYATRVDPGPPFSSLIGWEMQLSKAKPTRARPRSLQLVLSPGVTELDVSRIYMSLEARGHLAHQRLTEKSPLLPGFLLNSFKIDFFNLYLK